MSRHVRYKVGKVGRMYVVRRLEDKIDARGKHTGSSRVVTRHDNAADAERTAQKLRIEQADADEAAGLSR